MPATETLPSRLMPDILERVANKSPLVVFDIGMGVHETVELFGQRRCRLHFSALHDALTPPPVAKATTAIGRIPDKKAEEDALYKLWMERFSNIISYSPDTRFDVCLFWDFFNYLDDIALRAFADVLTPFLSPTTLAHAYLLLKPGTDVLNREYGILSQDQISVRPGTYASLPAYPRPQARVTSMLKGFSVNHSVLRRDGLLEVALKSANR